MKRRAVFSVGRGLDCVTCALAIEKRLKRLEGVEEVGSAVMLNKVFVDYDDLKTGVSQIRRAIEDAGYGNHMTSDRG